jgi:thiamine pyrophosphokinase
VKKCIILANGKAPSKKTIEYLAKIGYSALICADGGANTAYKYKLLPNAIIGDFDSISQVVLKYYSDKCIVKKIARQNDTDVEKCLKFAINKKYKEAVLLGVTGDRLDHSYCNLGILLKFYSEITVTLIHGKSLLKAYEGKVTLSTVPGETISIYGFNSKTKFVSSGMEYPLKDFALPFGVRESTSNVATGGIVEINIKGGKAFIIRDFNKLRKHGLL